MGEEIKHLCFINLERHETSSLHSVLLEEGISFLSLPVSICVASHPPSAPLLTLLAKCVDLSTEFSRRIGSL